MLRTRPGWCLPWMLVAISVAACSPGGTSEVVPSAAGQAVELTVFGAASLKTALAAVKAAHEGANPGTSLVVSTNSSAALATKIEQGAPADVFLSADTANPQRLSDGGLTSGDPVVFATNRLAIIVPVGNPGAVSTPADLARIGLKVVAAGEGVPITRYASQLVANLGREPGYPADFEAAYARNVVSREDNARAVVARVELGEADAGIVYATDAVASGKVTAIVIPERANVLASYAGVVIGSSRHQEAACAFLAWLAGPAGQGTLADFGFLPPR